MSKKHIFMVVPQKADEGLLQGTTEGLLNGNYALFDEVLEITEDYHKNLVNLTSINESGDLLIIDILLAYKLF